MKKKIIILAMLLGFQASSTFAGVWSITIHSRANCMNNESITWWANNPHTWRVISVHNIDWTRPSTGSHQIDTGWANTWRQAAVHWNESPIGKGGRYFVVGFHYYIENGNVLLDNNTRATDCSIYNGWWG